MKSINTYTFNVYALDAELDLAAGASRDDLLDAMDGHILAGGQVSTSHVGPIIKHGFE